jgi:outer membrane receptor protein involved in Fe transport
MRCHALLITIALALPSFAQVAVISDITTPAEAETDQKSKEKKPKLEETIVVTATRSERAVSELPVSTEVVTQEELKTAPALWVDDILRTMPGVQMALSGTTSAITTGQRVSMHGLGGTRALVLLDGIPMHDPYYGTVQWQKVPVDSLRQVEIVRGGNASLFGSSALGGTINLLTRPIERSEIRADVTYGTMSTERGSLSVDQMVSDRLGLRFSHTRFSTDGYYRIPNYGPIDIRGWNDTQVTTGRGDFTVSEATHGFLKATLTKSDLSEGTRIGTTWRDIFDAAGGMHFLLTNNSLLSTSVYYQDQTEKRNTSGVIGARVGEFLSQAAETPVKSGGASIEWSGTHSTRFPLLSLGVDVQRIEASEDRTSYNRTGAVTSVNALTGTQEFAGVFGQVSWRPNERLEILTSARLDYYKNADGVDAVVGGDATYYPESTTTELDPRVSFRYQAGPRSAVRGAVYRAFKAPTLRELYRSGQTGNTIIMGNPYLKPETLVGAEVGWEYAVPRARFEVVFYRSDIEGLQARSPVPGAPANVVQAVNLGKSTSKGIETSLDFELTRNWSINAAYTYADSIVTEDPDASVRGNRIPEVIPHYGTLQIRYHGDSGLRVDARGRIVSSHYGESTNARSAPAHRILDLSASYPVTSWIDAYAILENAFDEHFYSVLTPVSLRSGQPRTFNAGLRFLVPTGGRRVAQ